MNEIMPISPKHNLPVSSAMSAIIPRNMDEAFRLAQLVHISGLAPAEMKDKPEKIMIAVMHGMELGLKPMQAIQRIAVINGRPTIWGDAAIGLVRASGLLESIKETIEGEGDARRAVCVAKRREEPEPEPATFSVADAKVAGLWGKSGPWKNYPDRMLKMRARGFALRDGFADVLGGMYLAEELQGETIDAAPGIPTPPTPPKIENTTAIVADIANAAAAKIAEGPNRSERGEFADKNGVEIPLGALTDFDAFHKALDSCPTLDSLNAMYDALTKNMHKPEDLDEAQDRLREIASKFPVEDAP